MNIKSKILVVDDNREFLTTMYHWLKSKGHSVRTAATGEDALRIIKEDTPDIVFLDIIMPHMDGYTVLKLVREFNKTIPVVLMSAYEEEGEAKKKTHFYGVYNFFDKDQDLSKAQDLIDTALGMENNKNI